MNKKQLSIIMILVVSVGIFSSCSDVNNTTDSMNNTGLEQKNKDISITGVLSQNGEFFFVTDQAGTIHDVETYSVDFSAFVGSTVTVSGQYSGDTLFVTEIE